MSYNITYTHNSLPINFRIINQQLLIGHFINAFNTFANG